jgi:UDP-N-acetylglucosamine:LPS N-acetylglucosamine transferase
MQKKVLAVASGGGHWKQLMLLKDAFSLSNVKYVTTIDGLPQQSGINEYAIVKDSNKDKKFDLFITTFQLFKIIITFRPNVIISTGAAPGLIAIFFGRLIGAKTIWIDSIANSEELSFAGKLARSIAHQVLSQWPDVAANDSKVSYKGAVY